MSHPLPTLYSLVSLCCLLLLVTCAKCDIRCHCNQPICVRTGYMCKSQGPQAGCFVEHSGYVNVDRSSDISRHGCIEMLPIEERAPCLERALVKTAHVGRHSHHHTTSQGHASNARIVASPRQNKNVTCCLDDMCNYVRTIFNDSNDKQNNDDKRSDYLEGDDKKDNRRRINLSSFNNFERHLQESFRVDESYRDNLWLEVIIILVLLVFILFILILCVVRFIRNEEKSCQRTKITKLEMTNNKNKTRTSRMLGWCRLGRESNEMVGQKTKAQPFTKINMETDLGEDCRHDLPNLISGHLVMHPPPSRHDYCEDKRNCIYHSVHCCSESAISQLDLVSFQAPSKPT